MDKFIELIRKLEGANIRCNPDKIVDSTLMTNKALLGFELYRLVSGHPHVRLLHTKNGDDTTFYLPNSKRVVIIDSLESLSLGYKQDALFEDLLLKIIDYKPGQYQSMYEDNEGHIKVHDFIKSFKGYKNSQDINVVKYHKFLEFAKTQIDSKIVLDNGRNRINGQIKRHNGEIRELILAASDVTDLRKPANDAFRSLKEYGFKL